MQLDNVEMFMNHTEISRELLDFISHSPTVFHAVDEIKSELDRAGFVDLPESAGWNLAAGGKYYAVRNSSSIIAFSIGSETDDLSFRIAASHCDSPTYKLKAVPFLEGPDRYLRLNVEAYGGTIDSTWTDRPLSLAGRVLVSEDGCVRAKNVYIDKDILLIPNIAIHFNREVNSGVAINRQTDMCPLVSAGEITADEFNRLIAEAAGTSPENIVDRELYLVNRQKGTVWGLKDEFISSPKLDDLQCAFASLKGFLSAENPRSVNVFCCFDNEEVGSGTKQGALSTFLKDCLERICLSLGKSRDEYCRAVSRSFLLSADNAHAVHPNHPEKTDQENKCFLNRGLVIKENASQKYTTDAFSRAIVRKICELAGEPFQLFANRSDCAGGSTLGNLSNSQVSLHAADIGLPMLAMHSSFETAGSADTLSAINVFSAYYRMNLVINGSESFSVLSDSFR